MNHAEQLHGLRGKAARLARECGLLCYHIHAADPQAQRPGTLTDTQTARELAAWACDLALAIDHRIEYFVDGE